MRATYLVRMRHDGGRMTLAIYAESAESAAARVCALENAPRRAVESVRVELVCRCGARRVVPVGDAMPVHVDTRAYPRFTWCALAPIPAADVIEELASR